MEYSDWIPYFGYLILVSSFAFDVLAFQSVLAVWLQRGGCSGRFLFSVVPGLESVREPDILAPDEAN